MGYLEERSKIKSGDLISFRGSGFFAWLIRTVTRSEFCHVAIAWRFGDRILLIESTALHGVSIHNPLSQVLGAKTVWFPSDRFWNEACEARAVSMLGESYGWVDAIRAGLGLRATSKGLQCAEYAAMVLGIPLVVPTPERLIRYFPEGVQLA